MYRSNLIIRLMWIIAFCLVALVLITPKRDKGVRKRIREPERHIEGCPPFTPDPGFSENIFFIETDDHLSGCLTPRAVCSIESTARANPQMKIHVYIDTVVRAKAKKTFVTKRGTTPSCTVTDTLQTLPNVQVIKKDLRLILNESNAWHKLEKELFMEDATQWTNLHLKNAVKYILLKTYGGIYMDMKVVTYRPVHCLRNFVLERFRSLGTEIMAFDKDHPFVSYLIRLVTAKYDPESKESTGSPDIREAFCTFCNVSTAALAFKTHKCHKDTEIRIGDWEPFSPISRLQTLKYFGQYPDTEQQMLKDFYSKSYLAFIDGSSWAITVPPTSPYGVLARHYCPTASNSQFAKPSMDF